MPAGKPARRTTDRPAWPSWLLVSTLFGLATLVTYLRDPNLYRLPTAAFEDGRDFFAFFYNHPRPSAIFRHYNGYISLLPNVVGYLAARLPVVATPFALAWWPLVATSLAFAYFSSTRFRPVIGSDALRATACLALALAPIANRQFVSTTAYSIWGLLLLLMLAAISQPPAGRRAVYVALMFQGLAIFSHPLSILLTPIYLLRLVFEWGAGALRRVYYASLALLSVSYQLVAVEHGGGSPSDPWPAARLTVHFILERVVFNTLFSDRASKFYRREGIDGQILPVAIGVVAILAVLVFLARRRIRRTEIGAALALVYFIVALTAAYVVGRDATVDVLTSHAGHRYFWVQRLCFVLLLFVIGQWAVRAIPRKVGRVAIAVLVIAVASLQVVRLNRVENSKYASRVGMGKKLEKFTRQVAAQESAGDGAVDARLERGRWSIALERDSRR